MLSDAIPVKPQRLMKELREVLPRDVIVFADIGNTLTWASAVSSLSRGSLVAASGLALWIGRCSVYRR